MLFRGIKTQVIPLIILKAFLVLKARVVVPVTYGQLYVCHQNTCTACFIFFFLFTSAFLLQACKRSLLGQVPSGRLFVHVLRVRCDTRAPGGLQACFCGFWGGKGDEGLSRVCERLYRLFAIIVAEMYSGSSC